MKNKNQKLSLVSRILIFFGYPPRTIEQCRLAFTTARHPKPDGFMARLETRLRVYLFTPIAMKIHSQWVELCVTGKQAMDAFFSANWCFDRYEGAKRILVDSPLKDKAAIKWLEFLTDWRNRDHARFVWNLSMGDYWIRPGSDGFNAALKRREEFAQAMMDGAVYSWEALHAMHYAENTPFYDEALRRLSEFQETAELTATNSFRSRHGIEELTLEGLRQISRR